MQSLRRSMRQAHGKALAMEARDLAGEIREITGIPCRVDGRTIHQSTIGGPAITIHASGPDRFRIGPRGSKRHETVSAEQVRLIVRDIRGERRLPVVREWFGY